MSHASVPSVPYVIWSVPSVPCECPKCPIRHTECPKCPKTSQGTLFRRGLFSLWINVEKSSFELSSVMSIFKVDQTTLEFSTSIVFYHHLIQLTHENALTCMKSSNIGYIRCEKILYLVLLSILIRKEIRNSDLVEFFLNFVLYYDP